MPRFFVNPNDVYADVIKVTGEDFKHIKNVLRLKLGDNIIVSDGNFNDYVVKIESFDSNCVNTSIISSEKNTTEPSINVTLFQGMPKSDKMDLIIQKSVELGVKRIIPVLTERTVVKLDNKKDVENKVTRWRRIALEAAKQCNRGMIPEIGYPLTFKEALEHAKNSDLNVIPYEKETNNKIRELIVNKNNIKNISIMIGPEGGFSENEIQNAISSDIKSISLGPRILRTETAGLVVISILMYELGDVS